MIYIGKGLYGKGDDINIIVPDNCFRVPAFLSLTKVVDSVVSRNSNPHHYGASAFRFVSQ